MAALRRKRTGRSWGAAGLLVGATLILGAVASCAHADIEVRCVEGKSASACASYNHLTGQLDVEVLDHDD